MAFFETKRTVRDRFTTDARVFDMLLQRRDNKSDDLSIALNQFYDVLTQFPKSKSEYDLCDQIALQTINYLRNIDGTDEEYEKLIAKLNAIIDREQFKQDVKILAVDGARMSLIALGVMIALFAVIGYPILLTNIQLPETLQIFPKVIIAIIAIALGIMLGFLAQHPVKEKADDLKQVRDDVASKEKEISGYMVALKGLFGFEAPQKEELKEEKASPEMSLRFVAERR